MGQSVSWLAFRGAEPELVRRQLGLVGTGDPGEPGEAPVVGATLPDGWYLVVAAGCDHAIVSEDVLKLASAGGTAVGCSIEEHVMFASATLWRGGAKRWTVRHQGDLAIGDLDVSGDPPVELEEVRRSCAVSQAREGGEEAEVDFFFEIPVELARGLTGFRHDALVPGSPGFEVLRAAKGGAVSRAARPWWRFW